MSEDAAMQRSCGVVHVKRRGVTSREPHRPFIVRGIYDADAWGSADAEGENKDQSDDAAWRSASAHTFETAEECEAWVKAHKACTNPDYPQCAQIYTTLVDWQQVRTYLLQPLAAYRTAYPARAVAAVDCERMMEGNRFAREEDILRSIRERLDLPFHATTSEESTLNTLRYLFFHMRYGIFVLIRDNALKMFVPFVNKDFRNTWGSIIKVEEPILEEYVKAKFELTGRREDYLLDTSRWWANGNIICNVEAEDFWGDSYLPQLREMLQTLCASRVVPDVEFFINKRDFPQLKRNLSEPYDFIYDRDDMPLPRELYATYAPIASFFVGRDFADLPLVTTDDWETATGKVYPPNAVDYRSARKRKECAVAWKDRVATAIFRGNSTGPGTTTEDNQRIKLAALSLKWKRDAAYNANNPVDGVPYLDAGLVGWNFRDRKLQGRPMTFIKTSTLGIPTVEKVPMYAQMRYKYQLYVDGHCAAMRYASMMPLGSVILKVASYTRADSMWYFPLLRPYDIRSPDPDPLGDHIPVKVDLSDLAEVITWCKTHDAECERIAQNSGALYTRLIAREGQIDYLQLLTVEIARRFRSLHAPADLLHPRTRAVLMPRLSVPPHASGDWFDPADSDTYTRVLIGPSRCAPPRLASVAITICPCPSCDAKRAARATREAEPPASAPVRAPQHTHTHTQAQHAAAGRATAARPPTQTPALTSTAALAATRMQDPKFLAAAAAAAAKASKRPRE